MNEWQPIETAPKDGKPILILNGETIPETPNIRVASFLDGPDAHRLGYKAYLDCGGWLIWNDDADFYVEGAQYPTHWMPLPAPPPQRMEG